MAFNKDIDYADLLNRLMAEGGSAEDVQSALDSRVEKATSTPGLERFAYDDTYKKALDYIQTNQTKKTQVTPYQSVYTDAIDEAKNAVLNFGTFEYDHTQDPVYQAYEKEYTRGGENAMKDTLAQVSARTGGIASSYAGQAAQQANEAYMQALGDKIPELAENAYSKYLNEYAMANDRLSTLLNLDATDYARYLDEMDTLQSEHQTAAEAEKEAAMMAAYGGDFSRLAAAFGITEAQAKAYFDAANGTGSSGGGSSATEYGDDVRAVAAALNISLSEAQAYKNLGASPWYTTLQQLGLYGNGVLDYVQSQKATPGAITLPDTGDTVSESEALRLVEAGAYVVTGYDKNGNVQLAPAANRTKIAGYTK